MQTYKVTIENNTAGFGSRLTEVRTYKVRAASDWDAVQEARLRVHRVRTARAEVRHALTGRVVARYNGRRWV